jgi:hypothetical protein
MHYSKIGGPNAMSKYKTQAQTLISNLRVAPRDSSEEAKADTFKARVLEGEFEWSTLCSKSSVWQCRV